MLQLPPTASCLAKTTTLLRPKPALAKSKTSFAGNRTHAEATYENPQCGNGDATSRQREDWVQDATARCVQEKRRGKNTLNRERDKKDKIGGLTSGDWGGLGSYLWGLTLERGNLAKQRRKTGHSVMATWPAFMSHLSNFSTIIHSTSINVHLMLYEGYPFKCNRVHE